MKVHLLPIEPFEERYTEQWQRWWPEQLMESGLEVCIYDGGKVGDREGGEFLDPIKTWIWKGTQVAALANAFRCGSIRAGDVVLSLDGWGPASTAVAYMRAATGIDCRLALYLHAGSYDPWDFLALRGMSDWAAHVERGWFQAADVIFVATKFHRELLVEHRGVPIDKVHVSGLPIAVDEIRRAGRPMPWQDRPLLVTFPHRLATEKAPWEFDQLRSIYEVRYGDMINGQKVYWVKTRDEGQAGSDFDGYSSKSHYYRLLGRSRVVVSTARQETYGIAMQEGIALGAWAVCPNRLSYPELISAKQGRLYNNIEDGASAVHEYLQASSCPTVSAGHGSIIARVAQELIGRFGGRG